MSAIWADVKPESLYLVARRPPLDQFPSLYRWLARWLYQRMHWSPDYGIEYQAIYTNEAEARYAASAPGWFYMELPFDSELPPETCAYGTHDFPHSDASRFYRRRRMPFTVIPTKQLDCLQDILNHTE